MIPHEHALKMGVEHFDALMKLTHKLASIGLAIHEHQYYPHFNSSWAIVVGTHDHAIKFFWDQRDQVFTVEESNLKETECGTVRMPHDDEWKHVSHEFVDTRKGKSEFEFMEAYLRAKYSSI